MKKFTLISLLMLICCTMAKAELMDKFFFKIPTDKADGWTLQDAGRMTLTPGKDYLEVKLTNNGGRMINRFWNEDAWKKVDVASLPNNTYKFSKDMKMTVNATRTDMEFVLLPVNACSATDSRVSSHNYHWFNNEGEDYFFRYRVTASTAETADIVINENPTARGDWPTPTEESETATLNVGVKYSFAVEINVADKTATYTISDEEGNVVKTGVHNYVCEENRAGIWVMSTNSANSVIQLSNMGLSYKAEGPFAVEPSVDLLAAIGEQRAYYVDFSEGHTLHWIQVGDAEDALGNAYADGEEYTVGYGDANDTREFEQNAEEYFGKKIIYCTKSGDLKVWTSLDDDEAKVSDEIITPVVCETIAMPVPVAKITNVEAGYGKEYTITADNSNTLLNPVVTIKCIVKNASGSVIEEKDILSGEKVKFTDAGSIEMYSFDGTHPQEWYAPSEKVTITNNAEYVVAVDKSYIMTYDEINAGLSGWDKVELVDAAGKSHWDRIMSSEKRGYKADGTNEVYVEDNAASYTSVKEGHGIFADTDCGTENAKWNVLCPNDVYTCALPLIPSEENAALYKVFNDHYAWCMMPFEGLVYYDVNTKVDGDCAVRSNYLNMHLDPQYTSDDASKPNFFIVNKTGGYNRPDKGDCTSSEVVVAGETFKLYRYDTAISSVKVMTYKGFVPGSAGISSINGEETVAKVRKIATKNGIVIVKGEKAYSVSGAEMK
ncbi:hypothetical protein [Prevotella sp. P5-92]|uniref:hypothetical protein n=1 Tax=Prevotella sp. P5-92 TaxID=2024222 RepID=UPI0011805A27|nr:hypothetical protein [Prevotella sp. P5-92]